MKVADTEKTVWPEKEADVPDPQRQWLDLRRHLMGRELKKLRQLEERLDDPAVRSVEISRLLPDAISLSMAEKNTIARSLQPIVDESLKVSVSKNPQALAEAISPALGPGIRKAIRDTIFGMIQSLNTILNQSFSLHGLKWRFEAFRTRTTFAEVVLLHTLIYQVEQIFLIHRNTGLVLCHVEAPGVGSRDPDLVSGMLTAIQDFMKDSFASENDDELETLRMGEDRSIWIEQGYHAILAIIIRGRPPLDLRQYYREMVEAVHLKYAVYLESFTGDITPFLPVKDLMEDGLRQKVKEEKKRSISPLFILIIISVIAIFGFWGIGIWQTHLKFVNYVALLKKEPGIVVIQSEKKNGCYEISCLRDPLSREAGVLVSDSGLPEDKVNLKWEPFYSLKPSFIAARSRIWLKPPETVSFKFENNMLHVSGSAPHKWIEDFRRHAVSVPGISAYDIEELEDTDIQNLNREITNLSNVKIFFDTGENEIRGDNMEILHHAGTSILQILKLEKNLGIFRQIVISGYADASGTEKYNKRISRKRAERIRQYFIDQGIPGDKLLAVGKGLHPDAGSTRSLEDNKYLRTVSFFVAPVPIRNEK